jgi:hypothetical protein
MDDLERLHWRYQTAAQHSEEARRLTDQARRVLAEADLRLRRSGPLVSLQHAPTATSGARPTKN